MSEREFTRLVDRSLLPSLGRKLLFVFPLTDAKHSFIHSFIYLVTQVYIYGQHETAVN